MKKRLRDYEIVIGELDPGTRNAITDVEGVTIGHSTIDDGPVQTGVTAILPHPGNLFQEKLIAAASVFNGFGKTVGTVQLDELGTLETPILLTSTLNVGIASDTLVDDMLKENPEIGRSTGTINPVVGECNDMILNDIRQKSLKRHHILEAIQSADVDVEEGSVGAGRGMVAFSMKGGIGTSSRTIHSGNADYTLGVLVLSNFGHLADLSIDGRAVGKELNQHVQDKQETDQGSIIIILATDLPVTSRQLKRITKRCVTGLARTGSIIGHGSGDLVIGFSTAQKIPHDGGNSLFNFTALQEEQLEPAFRAAGEATEEAILNSLVTAETVTGRNQHTRKGLMELLDQYKLTL